VIVAEADHLGGAHAVRRRLSRLCGDGHRPRQRRGGRSGYENRKPFAFTGTIKKVTFDVNPHSPVEEEHELHKTVHHGHTAHALAEYLRCRYEEVAMKLHDTIDVLIGGNLSKDAAEGDYTAVLDCGGHLEGAVTRAVQKVIGEAEGNHVQALKGAIADAEQKMAEKSA
jgi:hypothetical protein